MGEFTCLRQSGSIDLNLHTKYVRLIVIARRLLKSIRMNHYEKHNCLHCDCPIDEKVYNYSTASFGFQLCFICQHSLKITDKNSSEAIKLYLSLKKREVPATLEKPDGHKTIDIEVADARVNIEVDGTQHHSNYNQAFSD